MVLNIWQQAWTIVQLGLAVWIIPAVPAAVTLATMQELDWPAWGTAIIVLAFTWPVAWYIWLLGDDYAIRR